MGLTSNNEGMSDTTYTKTEAYAEAESLVAKHKDSYLLVAILAEYIYRTSLIREIMDGTGIISDARHNAVMTLLGSES